MNDLIYCGERKDFDEIKNLIISKYPDAKIDENYDDIHGYRLGVEIESISKDDYIKFIIQEKIATLSLLVGLMRYEDPAHLIDLILQAKGIQNAQE